MGWEYTNADRVLRGPDRFRLRIQRPEEAERQIRGCGIIGGRSGSLSPVVEYKGDKWTDIEFQFPPKVLTDGRKASWKEKDLVGEEPYATFRTSGPRELSISWAYVVDSHEQNTDTWSIDRITRNIRTLRGYFANIRDRQGKRENLVIYLHMWCIGGDEPITARIRSVDVRYGDTLVFPRGGLSDRAFPLRTDITLDIRVWTKGKGVDAHRKRLANQDLPLVDKEPPSWY